MKVSVPVLTLALASLLTSACNKQAPTPPNYSGAIDAYFQAHPACLWQDEKKFPVQAATSDDAKTQGYDALVDAGLLTRTTSEKKIIIISKQENNYDLSPNGRSAWTADPSQPGYGNFCYGHRKVTAIDSSTLPPSQPVQPGATATVAYHYTLTGVPSWASAAETQTAFPQLQAANTPQAAAANLTDTSQGWQVSSAGNPPSPTPPAPADGKIVQ